MRMFRGGGGGGGVGGRGAHEAKWIGEEAVSHLEGFSALPGETLEHMKVGRSSRPMRGLSPRRAHFSSRRHSRVRG